MKRIVVLSIVLALSGCMDEDISAQRGIPSTLMQLANQTCTYANSSLDRVYIHSIIRTQMTASVLSYGYQYDFTSRCLNNAKFLQSMVFEEKPEDYINSTEPSNQGTY